MSKLNIFSPEFDAAVVAAGRRACKETLERGVPVSYVDSVSGVNVIEHPDGRKFEIRFLQGAKSERNYEVLREITKTAA
jgi:hypothetical protein